MRRRIFGRILGTVGALAVGASALALAPSAPTATAQSAEAPGFTISNGRLLDANGNDFVMRGVSHPHVWFQQQTGAFADIASLGANAVRVVLGGGVQWGPSSASDVANVISLCKQNELICVLEVHDTTGFGEAQQAATLDQAVDYWVSIKDALVGEEEFILINIGNEPMGNNQQVNQNWASDTSAAINRLRDEGFEHTIVVDAPNWGQDWQFIMRDQAADVFASDPQANTLFSIHMYGVFDTAAEVESYLNTFVSNELPIMIGEFGWNHTDGDPDEDAIMANAEALDVGYIGWSWSGNSGGVEFLDMTNGFNVNSLTDWGQRIFNGPNGIAATAECASVYACDGGGDDDTTPPTAPGQPTVTGVTSTTAALQWAASTDDTGVVAYDVLQQVDGADPVLGTTASTSITLTGLAPDTSHTVYVQARDAAGNVSAPSPTATFTTEPGGGGGGACTVDYAAGPWTSQPGQGGFTAHLTVTNGADTAVDGWTLAIALPAGQSLVHGWSATWSQTGQQLTGTNLEWNQQIPAGGSVQVGFNGSWTGSFSEPTDITLNGQPCDVT